jgi:hypothetical protein
MQDGDFVRDPYDAADPRLVEQARRRRRRLVLGIAAVTVAALAAVATGIAQTAGHDDTAPQPTRPSSGPTSTATAVEVDAATIIFGGSLVSYAAAPDGSLLTVWTKCQDATDDGTCEAAWQLQTVDDTYEGLVGGSDVFAYSAGSAFVVRSGGNGGFVVDRSGKVRRIQRGSPGSVSAGDALVRFTRSLAVVDPDTARWWPLPAGDGAGGWITGTVAADGTTWAMPASDEEVRVAWSDGAAWQHHVLPSTDVGALPGYLAVAGDHVAALSGYDGATVLPVADLAVTADGGRTWTDLHQADLPFRYVDAMAATSGGTLYVVTPGGEKLYRSTDDTWTHFAEIPNPGRADQLVPAGDRVIARGGSSTQPILVALDDAGRATPVGLTD